MKPRDKITKPLRYQIEGVIAISKFGGRVLLADEMGLGKTYQALRWLYRNPSIRPAIIVCPASLKYNWEEEARKHFGLRAVVLEGRKPRMVKAPIVILNYDILKAWSRMLKKMQPQCIVFDEAHFLKTRKAQRTRSAKSLLRKVPHVLALSGTPLTNRPAELWPVLNMIRPDLYDAFVPFATRYCEPTRSIRGTWEYKGATRLPELHRRLHKHLMIRRLKADVMKDLPSKTRSVVVLPLERPNEYVECLRDFKSWLRKNATKRRKKSFVKSKAAEALVKMGYLKRLAAELKLNAAVEWIRMFLESSDEKLIVFGIHRKIIRRLQDEFSKVSVVVDGSVKTRDRQAAVKRFQNDKRCRLFIGNLQAAGTGLTLTAAKTVAFVEIGWLPTEHNQAEDRAHRIGQTDNVQCVYLVGRGTLEVSLCRLLAKKQSLIDQTLDGTSDNVITFDVISLLEKELSKQ